MPLFEPPKNLPINTPPEDIFAPSSGASPKPPVPPPPPSPPPAAAPKPPVPPSVPEAKPPVASSAPKPPVPSAVPPFRKAEAEDIFAKTNPVGRENGMIPRTPNPMATIAESPALGLGRKLTRLLFVLIGIAVVGGGGFLLYVYVVAPALPNAPGDAYVVNIPEANQNANVKVNGNAPASNENMNANENVNIIVNQNGNLPANIPNLNGEEPASDLLPSEDPNSTLDTDGDGLTDYQETQIYNTDINAVDTDNDGLTDREEVISWKTDPNRADTDGDGYSDGEEIKNGYNPLGEGKLLPPITP